MPLFVICFQIPPSFESHTLWPLTSFLTFIGALVGAHIPKDSKLVSTYERRHATFVFLKLNDLTLNDYLLLNSPENFLIPLS